MTIEDGLSLLKNNDYVDQPEFDINELRILEPTLKNTFSKIQIMMDKISAGYKETVSDFVSDLLRFMCEVYGCTNE